MPELTPGTKQSNRNIKERYTMRKAALLGLLTITVSLGACVDSGTTRESGAAQQINASSLVGMRGRSMDDEMSSNGFNNVSGYKTDDASITMWWNAASRQCISVEAREGRVAKAESIVEGNCL